PGGLYTGVFTGSWRRESEKALERRDDRRLDERRSVADAGHDHQLALRQRLDHAPSWGSRQDVAIGTPHDQSGTRHAPERGPESGPLRRSDPNPLPDVLGIHLPDPAAVGPLLEHAERELALIFQAATRHDRRHLAPVGHRVVQGRELVWPAPDHLRDALAARLDLGPDVVDHQMRQTIRMGAGVGHRDDAAHRGSDEREPREPELVDARGQITDLVAVLIRARSRPAALAVAAYVEGGDVMPVEE